MIVPIAAWHEEHVYFAQLLDLLEKELQAFRGDATPNCELMFDIVSYLRDYGDAFHHPREDEAFRRLERRCPELGLETVRLAQEHRVIANAGNALCTHLAAVVSGAMVPRADIESAAATYLAYYRGHLAAEEEQILTRAALELDAEDWEAVRLAAPPAGEAPKSPGYYRELRRRIALEAV
jgi:hemerythrin-like domain-containing protein